MDTLFPTYEEISESPSLPAIPSKNKPRFSLVIHPHGSVRYAGARNVSNVTSYGIFLVGQNVDQVKHLVEPKLTPSVTWADVSTSNGGSIVGIVDAYNTFFRLPELLDRLKSLGVEFDPKAVGDAIQEHAREHPEPLVRDRKRISMQNEQTRSSIEAKIVTAALNRPEFAKAEKQLKTADRYFRTGTNNGREHCMMQ